MYLPGLGDHILQHLQPNSRQFSRQELIETTAIPAAEPKFLTKDHLSRLQGQLKEYETQSHLAQDSSALTRKESIPSHTQERQPLGEQAVTGVEAFVPSINEWLKDIPVPLSLRTLERDLNPLLLPPSPKTTTSIFGTSPSMLEMTETFPYPGEPLCDSCDSSSVTSKGPEDLGQPHDDYRYACSVANSAGSHGSYNSVESIASHMSHASWQGRKGRSKTAGYKIKPTKQSNGSQAMTDDRLYWCTWCEMYFKKPSDLRRHEESQHAPQSEWICMPEGAEILVNGHNTCVFCGQVDPNIHHLRHKHNQNKCITGDPRDRRFDRKDHLAQHLKFVHFIKISSSKDPIDLASWERKFYVPRMEPLWACGFCGKRWLTWEERYIHITEHMRKNKNFWVPCACVSRGYLPTLQSSLAAIGLPSIGEVTCHTTNWCGLLAKSAGLPCNEISPRPWPMTVVSDALFENNCLTTGIHSCVPRSDESLQGNISGCRTVGIPEEVCIMFWCGFCRQMLYVGYRPRWVAYDCERLRHFAENHFSVDLSQPGWFPLRDETKRGFYDSVLFYLRSNRVVKMYPLQYQSNIAESFAKKLTEHQTQIGATDISKKRWHAIGTSKEDTLPHSGWPKRLRIDEN